MHLLGQTNNWRHNVLNLSACPFFRMSPNLRTQYFDTNKPILTPIGKGMKRSTLEVSRSWSHRAKEGDKNPFGRDILRRI